MCFGVLVHGACSQLFAAATGVIMRSTALWLLVAAAKGSVTSLPRISVDPVTQHFVDETGRIRTFHGVNAVEKLPPFLPQATGFSIERSLSDIDAVHLSSWGINVVRLGVLWIGVVPAPGQVNQTYLEAARSIVRTLASHGIYTLIDMHQDVMGSRFCGEGFPSWAVEKALRLSGFNATGATRFPAPHKWDMEINPATGVPSRAACGSHGDFSTYYTTREATVAREAFFASAEVHADYGDHWEVWRQSLIACAHCVTPFLATYRRSLPHSRMSLQFLATS